MGASVPVVVTIKTVLRYTVSAVTCDEAIEIVRSYVEAGDDDRYLPHAEPTVEWSAEYEE